MDISFGQGVPLAEYVSFWPKDEYGRKQAFTGVEAPSTTHNFPEDVTAEGGNPDRTAFLDFLDEDYMRDIWREVRGQSKYSFFGNNCARAVLHLLYHGGGQYGSLCKEMYQRSSIVSPGGVQSYCAYLKMERSAIEKGIAKARRTAPKDVLR